MSCIVKFFPKPFSCPANNAPVAYRGPANFQIGSKHALVHNVCNVVLLLLPSYYYYNNNTSNGGYYSCTDVPVHVRKGIFSSTCITIHAYSMTGQKGVGILHRSILSGAILKRSTTIHTLQQPFVLPPPPLPPSLLVYPRLIKIHYRVLGETEIGPFHDDNDAYTQNSVGEWCVIKKRYFEGARKKTP